MTEQEQDNLRYERNRFQDLAVALAKLVLLLQPTPEQLLAVAKTEVREEDETEILTARIRFGSLISRAAFLRKDTPAEAINWTLHTSIMDALHQFAESDGRKPGVMP